MYQTNNQTTADTYPLIQNSNWHRSISLAQRLVALQADDVNEQIELNNKRVWKTPRSINFWLGQALRTQVGQQY